ncbi:MAG: endonuclease [Crocinitomicaceae bacterium]|nr:endonuclease [Crocinitomicaceae bacterium]
MVASARHCCACHRYKGVKLEIHHIKPQNEGGLNTFENGIVLCFDCHTDAGHYNDSHPRGTKFSKDELIKHKNTWFKNVKVNDIKSPNLALNLTFDNDSISKTLNPIFLKEVTKHTDIEPLRNIDYKKQIQELDTTYLPFSLSHKIKNFDDYILFLNGELFEGLQKETLEKEKSPQPFKFDLNMTGGIYKYENLSTCVVKLKLLNNSSEVIEDYKIYLQFEGTSNIERVDKRIQWGDSVKYNTTIKNELEAQFIPENSILVQNDSIDLDLLCFKPESKNSKIKINWKVLARNFNQSGQLELLIKPKFKTEIRTKYVESPENFSSQTIIYNNYKFY